MLMWLPAVFKHSGSAVLNVLKVREMTGHVDRQLGKQSLCLASICTVLVVLVCKSAALQMYYYDWSVCITFSICHVLVLGNSV